MASVKMLSRRRSTLRSTLVSSRRASGAGGGSSTAAALVAQRRGDQRVGQPGLEHQQRLALALPSDMHADGGRRGEQRVEVAEA